MKFTRMYAVAGLIVFLLAIGLRSVFGLHDTSVSLAPIPSNEPKESLSCNVLVYPSLIGVETTAVPAAQWHCNDGTSSENYEAASFAQVVESPSAVTLAKAWGYFDRGGAVLTFTTPYSTGCSGAYYQLPDLGALGWNDVISSAEEVYSNCTYIKLFVNTNYGGAVATCTSYCARLSDWGIDNKASSVEIGAQ